MRRELGVWLVRVPELRLSTCQFCGHRTGEGTPMAVLRFRRTAIDLHAYRRGGGIRTHDLFVPNY
jgi:hypothetical protein